MPSLKRYRSWSVSSDDVVGRSLIAVRSRFDAARRMPRSGMPHPVRAGCRARSRARRAPSRAGRRRAAVASSSRVGGRSGRRPRVVRGSRAGTPRRPSAYQSRAHGVERGRVLRRARPRAARCEQRAVRGVVERAQHAGDVAQRRALEPPLAERARRLALEVDDDEVLAGVEHLAEVVVAVAADAHRRRAARSSDARAARARISRLAAPARRGAPRGVSGSVAQALAQQLRASGRRRLRIDW